jgi:hypothetical protein
MVLIASTSHLCPYCEGKGCEECSHTGRRVRTHIDAGDGITMHVSGNAALPPEALDALAQLAQAAVKQMDGGA